MRLRTALQVLAKESPFAVSTLTDKRDEFNELKDYLYVKSDIEEEFESHLKNLNNGEILFLCGSSGDGKSEILTRYCEKYPEYHFHLDATHSFEPQQSAIQALDELFDDYKAESKPLIVGINIGMLANCAKEGDERHSDITANIDQFLRDKTTHIGNFFFLDFEQFPKFKFDYESCYSPFAKKLLQNLTAACESNPFYKLFLEGEKNKNSKLLANYKLLQLESVQDIIICLLFKVRLSKDQFITTRSLLDFIHHLLTSEGYLFDNLFCGGDNELLEQFSNFDPALLHSQKLDQFVLSYELGLRDEEREKFLSSLREFNIELHHEDKDSAASLIRLFRILSKEEFSNNYHHQFKEEFNENSLLKFSEIWQCHHGFDGNTTDKRNLHRFYSSTLIKAIQTYANRNAPELPHGELFIGEFGNTKLSASVEISCNYKGIEANKDNNCFHFKAYIKVNDKDLPAVAINLNLFELIYKINDGYHPNKYDKSAIILLDEIVSQIISLARGSDELKFYDGPTTYTAKNSDGLITISGGN